MPQSKIPHRKGSTSLPQEAAEYLKAWMMSPEHISHPYPTEDEKQQIMADTGVGLKQLTNWFVNNRRRYWKPRMGADTKALSFSKCQKIHDHNSDDGSSVSPLEGEKSSHKHISTYKIFLFTFYIVESGRNHRNANRKKVIAIGYRGNTDSDDLTLPPTVKRSRDRMGKTLHQSSNRANSWADSLSGVTTHLAGYESPNSVPSRQESVESYSPPTIDVASWNVCSSILLISLIIF
jgi:hypothetical protein